MIQREKIISSRIYLNLLHLHFPRPRRRKIIIDIQVTKFEVTSVLQPLCTVPEVVGIIQRGQTRNICNIFRIFRPTDFVVQIPVGDICVVSQRPVHACSIQHHAIMPYPLEESVYPKTFILKS